MGWRKIRIDIAIAIMRIIRINPCIPTPSDTTGKCDAHSATVPINAAGYRIMKINIALTTGRIGASSAAIKPRIVIGATTGAANRFATTDIGEM